MEIAGNSYENRPLKVITITNGDIVRNKKVIFIDAGIHARDWISVSTALFIIYELVHNFGSNKHLLENHNWVIMPVVNPDGYEFTFSSPANRMWKKTRKPYDNCIGVDLDRNFGYMFDFSSGVSDDPCLDTFKGPHPFSEPEAEALEYAINALSNDMVFYLTLRSFGDYLLHPWSFLPMVPLNLAQLSDVGIAGANAIENHSGRKYTVGSAAFQTFSVPGASMDFAYSLTFKIACTMKLQGGGERGYDPPSSSIKPYVKESWIGIVAMAKEVFKIYH